MSEGKEMITYNGKQYEGTSISVVNGVVTIDGKLVEEGNTASIVHIHGDVGELKTDKSVNCNNVKGTVDAGGSVNCANVGGDVDAGGSVNAGRVQGSVDAGGSVIHS